MRAIVNSAEPAFAATVCEDGSPTLSPKRSLLVCDAGRGHPDSRVGRNYGVEPR